MIRSYVKHNIVGNARSRRTVGFNRGIVAAAMMGFVNMLLIFIPIPDAQKVELIAAASPVVILVSYIVYGQLDKAVKGEEDAQSDT